MSKSINYQNLGHNIQITDTSNDLSSLYKYMSFRKARLTDRVHTKYTNVFPLLFLEQHRFRYLLSEVFALEEKSTACVSVCSLLSQANKREYRHVISDTDDEDHPQLEREVFYILQLDHFTYTQTQTHTQIIKKPSHFPFPNTAFNALLSHYIDSII